MKTLKIIAFILLPLALLLTACATSDNTEGGSGVSKREDLPEGDYTFLLQEAQSRNGSVYVTGLSGNYSSKDGFIASGEDVFTFKLCGGNGGFIGYLWEPGAAGLTSRTQYYGASSFYSSYYREAVKLDVFYPTACSYQFNESGELTELYECADLSGVNSWEDMYSIGEDEAMDILSSAIGIADGAAIVSYGQEEIDGELCWTFAYGKNTPEKFTAEEYYAVTPDGVVLRMDITDGEYKKIGE